jgi:hypothetical protein
MMPGTVLENFSPNDLALIASVLNMAIYMIADRLFGYQVYSHLQ